MAQWAADNGRTDLIVMNGDGSAPLINDYGDAAFTNLASPEVRDYQMDLPTKPPGSASTRSSTTTSAGRRASSRR
ncbi:MAG: hypothetical protein WKF45_00415 [Ilumatobacteraceae bacterium]